MSEQMPARIWAEDTRDGAWFGHPRSAYAVEYIRADIAERMAEALGNSLALLKAFATPDDQIMQATLDEARSALSAWENGR